MSAHADRPVAVIDACVLVGALKRDLLLTLAEAGFFQPRWSARILDEMERTLVARVLTDQNEADRVRKAAYLRAQMVRAFDEAEVRGYERLEGAFGDAPDPNDAHVLAAAMRCGAGVIVTDNVRHFPPDLVQTIGLAAATADAFVADAIDLDPDAAFAAIRQMRERFRNPSITPERLVTRLSELGMTATADVLGGGLKSL